MTEQTDKMISKSLRLIVILAILAGLSGSIGLPILLYWQLGKLESDSLRQLACASICLLPIVTALSFGFSFMLYKANRKGQTIGIEFARDSWSEVAAGLFKVAQARQPAPRQQPPAAVLYPYPPYQLGPYPAQSGMIIEQRPVQDPSLYE